MYQCHLLNLKWLFCKQPVVVLFIGFLIHSANLFLFIGIVRPFRPKVIIDMLEFMSPKLTVYIIRVYFYFIEFNKRLN